MVTEVSKGRDTTVPCFCGLSTDSKPTDVGNGAEFKEINTGDTYYYNEAGSTWVKWTGGSGGGGGGGGDEIITTLQNIPNGTATFAMYARYNSSRSGTINGTYTARVYGIKLCDLIGG